MINQIPFAGNEQINYYKNTTKAPFIEEDSVVGEAFRAVEVGTWRVASSFLVVVVRHTFLELDL